MLPIRRYNSKSPGLNDLRNWVALIDDDVVQSKEGSLLTVLCDRGPDIASLTDDERNSLSERITRAVRDAE